MRSTKIFLMSAAMSLFASMPAFAAGSPQTLNLPEASPNYAFDDDDEPEVTDRVARIRYVLGEAKIRRSGVSDWERVTLNLPLVEGDEIATEDGSRIELQFATDQHLRLSENANLKISTLRDEGIAVSISLGTMTLRLRSFDKGKTFFEIDAPKTTIAIQKAGFYRVDAGQNTQTDIRVTAREGGEARVYSDNSGFTLKSGRSSRIFIDGQNAGEWETGDALKFGDEFDQWSADRDATVAQRLSTAHYNTYYDNDIYGADDLTANGDWVFVASYGWVWRPSQKSLVHYADWSPYRYGQWRWMPPYGWIWVNDEPWGWATYHHGRWIHASGHWYWSPYGYYRPRRSWWFPALVVINVWGNNTCWYPMGWRHRWRNNNWNYAGKHNGPPRDGGVRPVALPGNSKFPKDLIGRKQDPSDSVDKVPPGGIVAIDTKKFGTGAEPTRLPIDVARSIIARKDDGDIGVKLPSYRDVNDRMTRDITADKPRLDDRKTKTNIGAGYRKSDTPLDDELKVKTIQGGRPPKTDIVDPVGKPADARASGVLTRPPKEIKEPSPVKEKPRYSPSVVQDVPQPVKAQPQYTSPVMRDAPRTPKETPGYTPPTAQKETPRYTPPITKPAERPRSDPPPARPPVKENPPAKNEPKPEKRPTRLSKDDGGKIQPDKP